MTKTLTINGVDVTDKVRLDSISVEMKALLGEVGAGRVRIDDTTGTTDLAPPMKEWKLEESDASPVLIAGGYVAERQIERDNLKAGTEREWVPVLEDRNAALGDRVLQGGPSKRPEETDYERVTWLLTTGAMGAVSGGAGQVPNTNTVTMGARNYKGKTPRDVLDECAEEANKNFHVYWDGSDWVLFYDKVEATTAGFTSSLRISDDISDIDNSVTFGPIDVEVEKDPERIYSHLYVKWANGWIKVVNDTTRTTFRRREKSVKKQRFKKAKFARKWANNALTRLNSETTRVQVSVAVPGTELDQLKAGMRIQIKLRSRGITAFTYFRITGVTFEPRIGEGGHASDSEYLVKLELRDKLRPVNLEDDPFGGPGDDDESDPPPDGGGIDTSEYTIDDFNRSAALGVVFQDDFSNRTLTPAYNQGWGTPSDGIAPDWTIGTGGSSGFVRDAVTAGEGYSKLGSSGFSNNRMFYDGTTTPLDFSADEWQATFKFRFDGDAFSTFHQVAFLVADNADFAVQSGGGLTKGIGARVYCTSGGCTLEVSTDGDAASIVWSTASITVDLETDYKVKVQRTGTTIRAKFWAASDSEPGSWTVSDTITTDMTGAKDEFTVTHTASGSGTWELYVDDIIVSAASGGTGWGDIPLGEGVDHDGPWEGGNPWNASTNSGAATITLDGSNGTIEATSDDTEVNMNVQSDSVDDANGEPWGPWSDGDGVYTMEFKVNFLGDTSDTDPNIIDWDFFPGDVRPGVRIHLGDNVNWAYMDPDQQRGYVLNSGSTFGTFIPKTLVADTFYKVKIDLRTDTMRAKLWASSANEPVAWETTLAKVEETVAELADMDITFHANTTPGNMKLSVNEITAQISGVAGEVVTTALAPGDGSTTTWTIEPFVGTVTVWVDGINTVPLSFDRDAGTFTLDRAPANGASIRVRYAPA